MCKITQGADTVCVTVEYCGPTQTLSLKTIKMIYIYIYKTTILTK